MFGYVASNHLPLIGHFGGCVWQIYAVCLPNWVFKAFNMMINLPKMDAISRYLKGLHVPSLRSTSERVNHRSQIGAILILTLPCLSGWYFKGIQQIIFSTNTCCHIFCGYVTRVRRSSVPTETIAFPRAMVPCATTVGAMIVPQR